MRFRALLTSLFAVLACSGHLSAQNSMGQTDSVVVLMNAKSVQLLEIDGEPYRKTIDARFLHNNTYLLCDTALWNVNKDVINAVGHVQIIQDRTTLSSEQLEYVVDLDLARFRGPLVELKDKDGNILRTNYLDYNTKDSTAFFERGASMKDKDGQVIESLVGDYDSKGRVFTFDRDVNMYTDSVFVKTSRLYYYADADSAVFTGGLDAWKDKSMISSSTGYYTRQFEQFFFEGNVHIMSDRQEGWSDSLYFNRLTNNIDMYGHVQVTDTSRHVSGLSQKLIYVDSLSKVTMAGEAAVIARTDEGGVVDTVYFGADRFVYWTVPKCDVPSSIMTEAQKRLEIVQSDPVSTYRKKSAEAAAKAAEEAMADDPNRPQGNKSKNNNSDKQVSQNAKNADLDALKIKSDELPPVGGEGAAATAAEELGGALKSVSDTLNLKDSLGAVQAALDTVQMRLDSIARADSLAAARQKEIKDSLANRDTTAIGFLSALGNIRIFKSDMQMACDSLEYMDIDSLARLFKLPKVWNEGNRQYTSDSIYVAIRNQKMDKANLMSNAFIIIEEEADFCYDQIKSSEIMAYFDSSTVLKRFDALGGANALFYLKENDAFATVNRVESKMFSAVFNAGELDRIYHFDSPKNDVFPVVQLPEEERKMKGFDWTPELRPKSGADITDLSLRPLEMDKYLARPTGRFRYTNRYFPGHMDSIHKMLESQDSLRQARRREARMREQWEADSLSMVDQMDIIEAGMDAGDEGAALGDLDIEKIQVTDSLSVSNDSLSVKKDVNVDAGEEVPAQPEEISEPEEKVLTPAELRAIKEAERKEKQAAAEAKRKARQDAKEARWAELDKRDAEKAARKAAKAQEKYRKKVLKKVIAAEKTAKRDNAYLEKYIEKYEKKMGKKLEKARADISSSIEIND